MVACACDGTRGNVPSEILGFSRGVECDPRQRHSQHRFHEFHTITSAARSRYLPDRPVTRLRGSAPRLRLERPLLPATRAAFSDVFAQRIIDWRFSTSMRTDFVLGAPEQVMCARHPEPESSLVHQSDCGAQYTSTATPSVWLRRVSSLQWAARATAATTPWTR